MAALVTIPEMTSVSLADRKLMDWPNPTNPISRIGTARWQIKVPFSKDTPASVVPRAPVSPKYHSTPRAVSTEARSPVAARGERAGPTNSTAPAPESTRTSAGISGELWTITRPQRPPRARNISLTFACGSTSYLTHRAMLSEQLPKVEARFNLKAPSAFLCNEAAGEYMCTMVSSAGVGPRVRHAGGAHRRGGEPRRRAANGGPSDAVQLTREPAARRVRQRGLWVRSN